jgi:hypothetical protein
VLTGPGLCVLHPYLKVPHCTARLWMLKVEDLINLASITAGRDLSTYELDHYLPGEKRHQTFSELSGRK